MLERLLLIEILERNKCEVMWSWTELLMVYAEYTCDVNNNSMHFTALHNCFERLLINLEWVDDGIVVFLSAPGP